MRDRPGAARMGCCAAAGPWPATARRRRSRVPAPNALGRRIAAARSRSAEGGDSPGCTARRPAAPRACGPRTASTCAGIFPTPKSAPSGRPAHPCRTPAGWPGRGAKSSRGGAPRRPAGSGDGHGCAAAAAVFSARPVPPDRAKRPERRPGGARRAGRRRRLAAEARGPGRRRRSNRHAQAATRADPHAGGRRAQALEPATISG